MKPTLRGTLIVTGGLGYIGSHIVVEILKQPDKCGYTKVIVIDNLSNSSEDTMHNIYQMTKPVCEDGDVLLERYDISDLKQMRMLFEAYKPIATVVHCATTKTSAPDFETQV
jgi:UDP-glucose 4-epimerase